MGPAVARELNHIISLGRPAALVDPVVRDGLPEIIRITTSDNPIICWERGSMAVLLTFIHLL
jgi:hypothetical protein